MKYGRNQPNNLSEQFLRKLEKARRGDRQLNYNKNRLSFPSQIQNTTENRMKRLHQVYLKVKVQNLVKQFIYKLKRNIQSPVPKQYQVIQNTLIKKGKDQNYFKTITISNQTKCILIILNNLCVLLLQTLSIFQGFFQDFRQNQSQSWPIIMLKSICIGVFFIKIIISLISQKVATPTYMKKLKVLAKFYFFSQAFFFDFVLLTLTIFVLLNPSSQVLGIVTFVGSILCFFAFSSNFQIIEVVYINNLKKKQYWDLMKMLIFDIFFAQFIVSIFVAMSFYDRQKNWIQKSVANNILSVDHRWWQVYIYAYYWAITTITSVGYGDITQGNYFQAVIVVMVMLFGYLVLAYNMSSIWNIVSNLRQIDAQKKQDTAIFRRMAQDENIPEQVQQKILNYIDNIASIKSQYEFLQRKQLLQKLPIKLREQYQFEASKNIFSKIPFFKFLHSDTLITLAQNIQRNIFYPGQYLTQKVQKLACVMILKHGEVGFAYARDHSEINGLILQRRSINKEVDNPYLLNKFLLTRNKQINYHIIATSYCFVYVITFQKFKNCLRNNSFDNEFYFKMYNKISYFDQEWDKFQCSYCSPRRHSIFQCPKLHFMPYKSVIIAKSLSKKSRQQKRNVSFRRKKIKLKGKHTLLLRKKYFKKFESNWQIMQKRNQITRMISIQVNNQNNFYKSPKMQESQLQQNILNKISQEFLRNKLNFQNEYEMQVQQFMDKMHNFTNFFPEDNPQKLIWISLFKKKWRTLRKTSSLNETRYSQL